ncbi:MAG: PEP-CTERM sorting domain-containing protein [Proteobacteria bacterium]|jgi:hypothetical protein|nr:PEP-CTERM sorting domain-containing protein [Pseudomonadota bacterium]
MKRTLLILLAMSICNCASADIIPAVVDYQYHGELNGSMWTWTKITDPGYGMPEWFTIPSNQDKWLFIPNNEQLDRVKHLWLQVEWQSDSNVVDPIVWVPQGFTVTGSDSVHFANTYVWEWIITPQSGAEIIQFPNSFSWAGVTGIDVATDCPEPSTIVLLGIGAIFLICRNKSCVNRLLPVGAA